MYLDLLILGSSAHRLQNDKKKFCFWWILMSSKCGRLRIYILTKHFYSICTTAVCYSQVELEQLAIHEAIKWYVFDMTKSWPATEKKPIQLKAVTFLFVFYLLILIKQGPYYKLIYVVHNEEQQCHWTSTNYNHFFSHPRPDQPPIFLTLVARETHWLLWLPMSVMSQWRYLHVSHVMIMSLLVSFMPQLSPACQSCQSNLIYICQSCHNDITCHGSHSVLSLMHCFFIICFKLLFKVKHSLKIANRRQWISFVTNATGLTKSSAMNDEHTAVY